MAEGTAFTSLDKVTVATLLLDYLDLEGVHTIFGIPGGALGTVLTALKDRRDTFTYVVCRQETGAAYAADGYYRVTGRLGVVMVTSGPGATNALTGTMNAQSDGSAVLTLSGEVPIANFGMGFLQEGADGKLDVNAVYQAATGYSSVVTAGTNFHTLLTQSLRDALTIPRQAVHLSLPNDVAGAELQNVKFPKTPLNYRAIPNSAARDDAKWALDALLAAKRPLILVGNGCRYPLAGERRAKLTALAHKYAFAVATTPDGKGVYPETDPLSLRVYGTGGCEWPYYYFQPSLIDPQAPPYDALLVLGSTLGGFATNHWDPVLLPQGPVIQVDANAAVIARAFPVDRGIVAELGAFIDLLDEFAQDRPPPASVEPRRAFIGAVHERSPFQDPKARASDQAPLQPAALARVLEETLPPRSNVFIDAGNCVGWIQHYLVARDGVAVHSALDMGPMGFAVGATLGAKIGDPHATCVGVVGDGAFLMHGAEVSTAHAHKAGAIWVVLNENDLHMVTQGQEHYFPDQRDPDVWAGLYTLGNPDLAGFARALGAAAYDVHDPRELADALRAAYAGARTGRPQVVVCHIDPKPVPPYYQEGPSK
jgi:acetolactate synthase I/II/III large subunit